MSVKSSQTTRLYVDLHQLRYFARSVADIIPFALPVWSCFLVNNLINRIQSSNAQCGRRLIHFATAIPARCLRMLDICMNKSRKDLSLGPVRKGAVVRCLVTPIPDTMLTSHTGNIRFRHIHIQRTDLKQQHTKH